MGILTDFYVAPRSAASDILAGKTAKLKKLEGKEVDTLKLESLEKVVAKTLKAKVKAGNSKLLTDEDGEQWVFLVSPSLVDLLTKAGDKTAAIAKAWAPELEGWKQSDVKKLVDSLVVLAADAKKSGKDLLLWVSL
jgi:hypothetical protein